MKQHTAEASTTGPKAHEYGSNAEEVRVHRTPWEGRYKEITTFAAADKISPQCLAIATLDLYMLFGGTGGK